jgi:hypothetical protein
MFVVLRSVMSSFVRLLLPGFLAPAALLGACGGTELALPDAGGSSSSSDGGNFVLPDGAMCVDIDLSQYSTSCTTDSDCTFIRGGTVCDGQCGCSGSPVNNAAATKYATAVAGLHFLACPCLAAGPPVCRAGSCTVCPLSKGGCETGLSEGGIIVDGGTTSSDSGVGVDDVTVTGIADGAIDAVAISDGAGGG